VSTSQTRETVSLPTGGAVGDFSSGTSFWQRIRRDVAIFAAGNIGVVAAQLVFRSILIAALVPVGYGRLSLVLGVYNTIWIIGASGLPSGVARYIAAIAPADDRQIINSAIRASLLPITIAGILVATVSGYLLRAPLACIFAAVGLVSLVYSLLAMGILRGRGRMGQAASILPLAALGEVVPLALLWGSGFPITPLLAFSVFCFGNVVGLAAGMAFTWKTTPPRISADKLVKHYAPGSRELLGFSMWLGAATIGVAILPLVIRSAAALDSYTTVAIIDVSIVLLSIPQRIGTVILLAVVPHATRALHRERAILTISIRENVMTMVPFLILAIIVAFTPLIGWIFDLLGRPIYAKSADYLALALLAGPARILYGVVEGILIAHGQGKLLARNALSVTAVASAMIVTATVLGNTILAFAVFAFSFWAIYLLCLIQVNRLARESMAPEPWIREPLANNR
jgi:O-antigen/teichoic acid export membrane protein